MLQTVTFADDSNLIYHTYVTEYNELIQASNLEGT